MSYQAQLEVLVVEDDRQILAMMLGVLTLRSFMATSASGDAEAIVTLENAAFDALLVDVKLATRRGFAVLQYVRTQLPFMLQRTVVVTADVDADVLGALKKIDVCDVVSKPIEMNEVIDALYSCCSQPSADVERRYWTRVLRTRFGVEGAFDDFLAACRLGWEAAADDALANKPLAQIERELAARWQRHAPSWPSVRSLASDAFLRVRSRLALSNGAGKSLDGLLGSFD